MQAMVMIPLLSFADRIMLKLLNLAINNVFTWFKHNGLIVNSSKSHFLVSLYEKISLTILRSTVESSHCEELLGIKFQRTSRAGSLLYNS